MNIFDKFNAQLDVEGLKAGILEAQSNDKKNERDEVPHGEYTVRIDKLAPVESKSGKPMLSAWFKILDKGEYNNQMVFMNQVLTSSFPIHTALTFLRKLGSDTNLDFIDFNKVHDDILEVAEDIECKFVYKLKYGENDSGYSTFDILSVIPIDEYEEGVDDSETFEPIDDEELPF